MTARADDQGDPTFVADLRESNDTTWMVARWLQGRGYAPTVRPIRIRPRAEQKAEYADEGDIEVAFRVEVKRRSIDFTCREDFRYDSIIVDTAHAWDNAHPKPFAYVLVNKAGTHAAIVKGETFPRWTKGKRMDRLHNREREFYFCPKDDCRFVALTEKEEAA